MTPTTFPSFFFFAATLIVTPTSVRVSVKVKVRVKVHGASKILTLGKLQIYLHFRSLIRIFAP